MPLRAIAYASEAIPGLSAEQVDDLSHAAAGFNLHAGVTGVLLHDGQRFLQYLEGPEDGIRVVYARILASPRHHEILELGRGHVSGRHFPYWSMRLLPAEPEQVHAIARADWTGVSRSRAVERLSAFVAPYLAH